LVSGIKIFKQITGLSNSYKAKVRLNNFSTNYPKHTFEEDPISTDPNIEEQDINNLTIPAVLIQSELSDQESTDSDSHNSIVDINPITMAQTKIDSVNTASKLIPVFDGKAENLTSFIDALEIIESIKGEHEQLAVSIIKTKLKGVARNLIGKETTITRSHLQFKTQRQRRNCRSVVSETDEPTATQ